MSVRDGQTACRQCGETPRASFMGICIRCWTALAHDSKEQALEGSTAAETIPVYSWPAPGTEVRVTAPGLFYRVEPGPYQAGRAEFVRDGTQPATGPRFRWVDRPVTDVDWRACWEGREEPPQWLDPGEVDDFGDSMHSRWDEVTVGANGRTAFSEGETPEGHRRSLFSLWFYRREIQPDGATRWKLAYSPTPQPNRDTHTTQAPSKDGNPAEGESGARAGANKAPESARSGASIPHVDDVDWRRDLIPAQIRMERPPGCVGAGMSWGGLFVEAGVRSHVWEGDCIIAAYNREGSSDVWTRYYLADRVQGEPVPPQSNDAPDDAGQDSEATCDQCDAPADDLLCPACSDAHMKDMDAAMRALQIRMAASNQEKGKTTPPSSCEPMLWRHLPDGLKRRVVETLNPNIDEDGNRPSRFGPPNEHGETCELRIVLGRATQSGAKGASPPPLVVQARRLGESKWRDVV